ncbi:MULTISPECIES: LysR family transcriptional regulator [Coprobacillaceae]|uniref:LysR family transcriptional regulator n=1 Tax=Coprobacillaceae TaxID=2810280 RepID=UPI000E4FD3B4|nr:MULTISPECIES: LysR family transcriptional regulator [Coprobacillaceae]RHM61852.1 LysR family transcriptional regulator [Coprobacillus sp. AF33-1AC]RHS94721.1 LysR family transcriptional regulator [Erysipelatoclostridium sp. AM42-17]
MNINQLYYFQTLAKYQHYTKASQELYISQPSLTHAIKELEKEINCVLFVKKGRNVVLSDEGKTFLKYVNQSLSILEQGVNEIANKNKDQQHVIQISVIATIINSYLTPVIKKLNEQNIKVQFRSEKTLDIIEGIKNNKYDFGICSKIEDSHLTFLPLLYEELVLITPKNHPLNSLNKVTFENIAQYPFITYLEQIAIYHNIMDIFKQHHLKPNIIYNLDDETSIASMVSLNFGVAIVAKNDLLNPFKDINIIPLDLDQSARTIYLAYNSNTKLSSTCKYVIDYMINHEKIVDIKS